jgi:iron complex transport system ATP-binding protein
VIAILHDLNLAVRFAERIVVIHRGAIAANKVPERTITDDIVRKVFEIDVAIQHHSEGSPILLPQLMRPATNACATAIRRRDSALRLYFPPCRASLYPKSAS